MGIRIGGRKVKFRFFVIIAILLIIIIYLLMPVFKEPSWDTVKQGEVTLWNEAMGVVVRQEEVYRAPDYGRVDFFLSKGQVVDKDALVGVLYRVDYDENMMEELYQVKSKISDYRSNSLTHKIDQNDYKSIEKSIKNTVNTIQSYIKNDTIGYMARNEKELTGLLKRREELLQNIGTEDSNLKLLYEQEKNLEESLGKWKEELLAPVAGMLAYETDGLEEILSPSVLDYLSIEQLQTFLNFQPDSLKEEEANLDTPLFKVVDPNRWYIASLIPQKDIFYDGGDDVKVKITGLGGGELSGTIFKVDTSKDSTLVVLEFTEGLENALDIRNIQIEIGSQSSGLMVSKEAIIEKNNRFIVKTGQQGSVHEVEVRVLAMDDEWAIIEKANPGDKLELNDSVLTN